VESAREQEFTHPAKEHVAFLGLPSHGQVGSIHDWFHGLYTDPLAEEKGGKKKEKKKNGEKKTDHKKKLKKKKNGERKNQVLTEKIF